jgi:signal transduction histidine kinase
MYEFLRKVPLFADLPDADLLYICESTLQVELTTGEELFAEGSTGNRAYVLQEGEVEIVKQIDSRPVLLAVRAEPGDIIGEMALLESAPRMATVRARAPTVMLAIHQEQFDYLLNNSPAAARVMLHTVLMRWRTTESLLRQSEKMAQLGTLTAGVAHELNNPAAAVKRSVDQIDDAIAQLQEAYAQLFQADLSIEQRGYLNELVHQLQARAAKRLILSSLERSDREEVLEAWLEARGVAGGWEMAPTLVNLGYQIDDLTELAEHFKLEHFGAVVRWGVAHAMVNGLSAEISEGSQRISDVVKALKAYVYLDQAPIQTVDVAEGIENTLLILRSKLGSGVTVVRDYNRDLPKIEAYASELNQVWTNIIANAVDAMDGHGQITICSRREGDWIVVVIEDSGPGIPPDIQKRIFDPFFTTKPPGHGTGLGLEITYNIVVHKHHGDIKVFSKPGSTRFEVWLPINFEAAEPGRRNQ